MNGHFFTINPGLKLASLVIAIALWFFVILSGRSEIAMDIPITFTNLPAELELLDSPQTVSVNIEGQERVLKNLKQKDISALVDLSDAKTGKSFITLTSENIKLPRTLEVIGIDPQIISFMIETQLQKSVSVKPAIIGLPEKGFAIVEIDVTPDIVTIDGPTSVISKIKTIKTEPIDISGINKNLQYKAKLNMINANVKLSVQKVDVNIYVRDIK